MNIFRLVEFFQIVGAVATAVLAIVACMTVRNWQKEKIHEIKTSLHSSICILMHKSTMLLEYGKKINVKGFTVFDRPQISFEFDQFESCLQAIERELPHTHKLSLDLKANKAGDIDVESLWREINAIRDGLRFNEDIIVFIDSSTISEEETAGHIDIDLVVKKIESLERSIDKLYEISKKGF